MVFNKIKKLLKIKITILIVLVTLTMTISNLFVWYLHIASDLEGDALITIESGTSVKEISQLLSDRKIIRYPILFMLLAHASSKTLKSGEYVFANHITPLQVLHKLVEGKPIMHKLFIPDNSTVQEIFDIVNSTPRLLGTIEVNVPEGYLLPSSYIYSYGDQKETIIHQMKAEMSKILDDIMLKFESNIQKNNNDTHINSHIKTRLDVLILASIVAKEAGNDEEKPLIAAVFLNRLKKHIKLQADPTVYYAITKGKYKLNRKLTKADLQINSPYNTYNVYGLPPTPIACPDKKSLEAVINPAKVDFLYFVANNNGTHNFANNLQDHNKNVRAFRAGGK